MPGSSDSPGSLARPRHLSDKEISEELIEAMNRRQKLVTVAKMIFAKLSSSIALWLQQVGERRILLRQALLCSW